MSGELFRDKLEKKRHHVIQTCELKIYAETCPTRVSYHDREIVSMTSERVSDASFEESYLMLGVW